MIIPSILEYIGKLLYLYVSTFFFKQPLNYTNIIQIVTNISKQTFSDLDYLVSKIGIIPKTIILIKKIEDVIALIIYLQRLLSLKNLDHKNNLIIIVYLNIETITQIDIIKIFCNREIKI